MTTCLILLIISILANIPPTGFPPDEPLAQRYRALDLSLPDTK